MQSIIAVGSTAIQGVTGRTHTRDDSRYPDREVPIVSVQDSLAETDVPLLLGRGRTVADFSDDSLGRALDKLAKAEPRAVFTAGAAQAKSGDFQGLAE